MCVAQELFSSSYPSLLPDEMAVATTMSRAVVSVKPLAARKSQALTKAPVRTRVQALSDTNAIISGATAVTLLLGRFAFLPIQRRGVEKAGLPQQNGQVKKAGWNGVVAESLMLSLSLTHTL